jgi:hypothetical protein
MTGGFKAKWCAAENHARRSSRPYGTRAHCTGNPQLKLRAIVGMSRWDEKIALVAGAFGVTVSAAMKTLSAKAKIVELSLAVGQMKSEFSCWIKECLQNFAATKAKCGSQCYSEIPAKISFQFRPTFLKAGHHRS